MEHFVLLNVGAIGATWLLMIAGDIGGSHLLSSTTPPPQCSSRCTPSLSGPSSPSPRSSSRTLSTNSSAGSDSYTPSSGGHTWDRKRSPGSGSSRVRRLAAELVLDPDRVEGAGVSDSHRPPYTEHRLFEPERDPQPVGDLLINP